MKILNSFQVPRLDKSFKDLVTVIQQYWSNLVTVLNGNVSFGNGVLSDNISGSWVSVTFSAANTNTTIAHNLNRLPVAYIPMSKLVTCDVYNGSVAPTKTQITLKCTVATTVLLWIM
jgi:hypothetical protein